MPDLKLSDGLLGSSIVLEDVKWSWFGISFYRETLIGVLSLSGVILLDADGVCNCVRTDRVSGAGAWPCRRIRSPSRHPFRCG